MAGVEARYGCMMPEIEVPVRVGYVFVGYFLRKNGYGMKYYNADGTGARVWNNTATITLYASWRAASYDVVLDLQDGNGGMDSATAMYGKSMPDIIPPMRPGYEFLGYYSGPEGAGEMYYDKDGRGVRAWNSATGGTLYAHWRAFGFSCRETTVCEGSVAEIRVMGGDAATNSNVKVYLTYNTAVAADIDKFPLTLSWAAGEIGEKVISIPTKADKAVEADEFFTLQLAEAEGVSFRNSDVCTVTIHDSGYDELADKVVAGTATKAELAAWNKLQRNGAIYIRGLADTAECGKVAGSGLCAPGKKVTLKATASKGWVFVGWKTNRLEEAAVAKTPSLVVDRTAKPGKDTKTSTTLTNVTESMTFFAEFVTVEADRGSIAAGLNGVRLEDTAASSKPPYQTNVMAGVALQWPIAADALSQTTVKVSGLPSGLKFTAKDIMKKGSKTEVEVPANMIYGAPTAASKADGKGGVKPSDVKITVTTSGKSSITYLVKLTVDPLPACVVGTFSGECRVESGELGLVGLARRASRGGFVETALPCGQVSLTIATSGKISGKILESGKTWTLSAGQFNHVEHVEQVGGSAVFYATVIGKAGKEVVTNEVTVSAENGIGVATSQPFNLSTFQPLNFSWTAYQNLWKRADTKAEMPVFKKSIVVEYGDPGDRDNMVKITFKTGGVVSFSGKKDGVSVSGSAQVVMIGGFIETALPKWQVTFYAPPKKGFAGWCETFDVKLTLDEQNIVTAVSLGGEAEHDKVQLWEGGPYWATTNTGGLSALSKTPNSGRVDRDGAVLIYSSESRQSR